MLPGWKIFFDTLWFRFGRRFDRILDSLVRHSDMIDREAVSIDIARAEEWRREADRDAEKQEELQASTQFSAVLAWLNVQDDQQEDELDQHLSLVYADSCKWFQTHRKASAWLSPASSTRILWVKGSPGAGNYFTSPSMCLFSTL